MNKKIKSFKEVCRLVKKHQGNGKKVVFVHGVFDILHRGHISLIVEAKKLGDVLVVGVDCDDNAKVIKGLNRPINNYDSRMYVLSYMEPVDLIFQIQSFKSKNRAFKFYDQLYRSLKPDIVASFVKQNGFEEKKKIQAQSIGAQYVNAGEFYSKGTSEIIKELSS